MFMVPNRHHHKLQQSAPEWIPNHHQSRIVTEPPMDTQLQDISCYSLTKASAI